MPFGRGKEPRKRQRKGRGSRRDPFEHLREERERVESGEPWFQMPDHDAPDLDVQAGISSDLSEDDLADKDEGK